MPGMLLVVFSLLYAAARADETPAADAAQWRRLAHQAGGLVQWLGEPYVRDDRARRSPSRPPAYVPPLDRRLLLEAALRRARAEGRLVFVYVWRVAGRHMYRAPVLDAYARLALFSDPELATFINRKFVPVRLYVDRRVAPALGVPLKAPGKPGFLEIVEPAFLFLSPEGKVLHVVQRIRTFSAYWTRHVLRQVLRAHPDYDAPSPLLEALRARVNRRDPRNLVALAEEECAEGREEEALAVLKEVAGRLRKAAAAAAAALRRHEKKRPKAGAGGKRRGRLWELRRRFLARRLAAARRDLTLAAVVRARALRLLGRGQEALAALARAGDGPEVRLERGRIELALGRWEAAAKTLAALPAGGEAAFRRGQALYLAKRREEARRWFAAAVRAGETPWSWRAAAMLARADDTTPVSPLAHAFEPVHYGLLSAYGSGIPRTTELGPRAHPGRAVDEIVRVGVRFLLDRQTPDGGWTDARYAYWPAPYIVPNVHMAVTALAATALLSWREAAPREIRAALARAEAYLRRDDKLNLGREEEVYSQAYRILYWVRKARLVPASRKASLGEAARLVRRVPAIQNKETGFFAHEYPNAFCTAAMLWSLHLAREAGVKVPPGVLRRGREALRSARREDGSFVYGGRYRPGRRPPTSRATDVGNLKNAMARMPPCEGALFVLGASDRDRLARAVQVFLRYLDRLARVRKCDFHSDGELGGFFFWHGLFHTSEVSRLLARDLKQRVRRALLELVTAIPEIDGSFVDSHELGKSYGTAMALLVLKNVTE